MMNGVFVDMGNLYYCVSRRFEGRRLDYKKLFERIESFGPIQRALAYGGEIGDEADGFKMALKRIGFDPKYRRLRTHSSNPQQIIRRIDWSVGIAVDVFRMMSRINEAVLCTANSDIIPLVNFLKEQNVKVTVFACGIPHDLKTAADRFIEIADDILEIKEEVESARGEYSSQE